MMQLLWNRVLDESKIDTFSEDDFTEALNKHMASEYDFGNETGELRKLLKTFYMRTEPDQVKNNTFYLERLADVSLSPSQIS